MHNKSEDLEQVQLQKATVNPIVVTKCPAVKTLCQLDVNRQDKYII